MTGIASPTQTEIEIFKSVADGENVIRIGEDVAQNQLVIPKGTQIRPAEIGGLMALGFTSINVAKKPRVGLISTGDEVIDPGQTPRPGQVRDINSYTLGALVEKSGGAAIRYGIFSDQFSALKEAAAKALAECDVVIITTVMHIHKRHDRRCHPHIGEPWVLVHGSTQDLASQRSRVCNGKTVIGAVTVSALVNIYSSCQSSKIIGRNQTQSCDGKLTVNLPSQAGRRLVAVKLIVNQNANRKL